MELIVGVCGKLICYREQNNKTLQKHGNIGQT